MSNRKNINWEDFVLLPEHCETPQGESMTVPDETLSIRQIVDKHMRGQEIADELMRTPIYQDGEDFDAEDLEKVEQMDLADRENLKLLLQQKNEENKEKLNSFFNKQTTKTPVDVEDVDKDGDSKSTRPKTRRDGSHTLAKGVSESEERSDESSASDRERTRKKSPGEKH